MPPSAESPLALAWTWLARAGDAAADAGLRAAEELRALAGDVVAQLGFHGSPWDQAGSALEETPTRSGRGDASPVRVAILDADTWPTTFLAAFTASSRSGSLEWLPIPTGQPEPSDADATVALHGHELVIRPAIDDASDPGIPSWAERWGTSVGLSYPSAFPLRLDPGVVTLRASGALATSDSPAWRVSEAPLLFALTEAAARLSRHPARWRGSDDIANARADANLCLHRLGALLSNVRLDRAPSDAERTLARLLSAWVTSDDGRAPANLRRTIAESAARIAGDEPEIMLRLLAARAADGDFTQAAEAAGTFRAMTAARARPAKGRSARSTASATPTSARWAYLAAELATAHPSVLAMGRLAAGVLLHASALPPRQRAFFAEDLRQDLEDCPGFAARPDERAFIASLVPAPSARVTSPAKRTAAATATARSSSPAASAKPTSKPTSKPSARASASPAPNAPPKSLARATPRPANTRSIRPARSLAKAA